MLNNLLTKEQLTDFKEYGYVVIKGFYDRQREIEPIQHGIWKILKIIFEKYHIEVESKKFSPETFDYGYQKLISINRKYGGEVYDAIKQIPAFMRLISLEKNDQIFMQLRNINTPAIASAGYGIRIDNPHEEKYRSLWHYEYRDQLRSIDGIVFWSPLVNLTSEMGPVQICPSSHFGGLRRSYLKDPDNPEKTGAYAMRLENEQALISEYGIVAPLSEPGDLILMDFIATCLKNLDDIQCFIDQNPLLHGTTTFSKPIITNNELPTEVKVIYVGLNPKIAKIVIENIDAWHSKDYRYLFL